MADLSTMSTEQLMQIAGIPAQQAAPVVNLSGYSNEQLMEIAGPQAKQQAAQQAVDYLNRNPVQKFADYGTKALQGFGFGFADEAIAGAAAPMEVVKSYFTQDTPMGLSEGYDTALSKVRAREKLVDIYEPVKGAGYELAGALVNPANRLKMAKGAAGVMQSVGTGALSGALYGFGSGEGGLENRTQSAEDTAKIGALAGGALSVGGKVLGATGRGLSGVKDKMRFGALGITKAEAKAMAKKVGARADLDMGQHPFIRAIDELDVKTFSDKSDAALWEKASQKLKDYGSEIDDVITIADDVIDTPIQPVKRNTLEYIEKTANAEDRAELTKKANEIWDALVSEGDLDGSLRSVQNTKVARAANAWTSENLKVKALDKAIARDLKETIEESIDQAVKDGKLPAGMIGRIRAINSKYGDMIDLEKIFRKKAFADFADDVVKNVRGEIRTSGGSLTTPTIMGGLNGAPGAGFAAGTLLSGASTRTGKALIGKGSEVAAKPLQATGNILQKGAGASGDIASQVNRAVNEYPNPSASRNQPQVYQSSQLPLSPSQYPQGSAEGQSAASSAGSAQAPQEYRKAVSSSYQNSPTPIMEANSNPKQNISYTPEKVKEIVADQPPLIRAMVKQESGGKPKARSNKGASGLMQILPSTAKEIASELGVEDYDLEDPLTSLIFGKHYIQKMYQEFNDPRLALAAYNAGPGKVKQWIKRWGRDWSTISRGLANTNQFSETRNYVRNIVNNAKEYA